uniref:Uncharacterized protein n=1 Tax=Sphaerodactylus townsendi TaxID=933632 RepID=A0ACB8FSG9_9SAUR
MVYGRSNEKSGRDLNSEGLSLICEVCGGPGNTCDGSLGFCSLGEDKCGITLIEGTGDLEVRSVVKTCIRSNLCDDPFTSVDLGKAGKTWTFLTCCMGDECRRITPTPPPLNTTPNGKTCPACYAVDSLECEEEIIPCTGDQFYCLEKSGSISLGERSMATTIKGCANNAYCNNMQDNSFDGINNVITANCTLASGTAKILPGLFGLLQVFAGLLLAKALN